MLTVSEGVGDYRAPGILDGLGAYAKDTDTVRVLASHELGSDKATTYTLANDTRIRGARVSFIDIDRRTRHLRDAGVAYQPIYDRNGKSVTSGVQINEKISATDSHAANSTCGSPKPARRTAAISTVKGRRFPARSPA